MKVGHTEIVDTSYLSASGRMALLIEEARHRKREIVAVTISAGNGRFYGTLFWTEKE